MAEVIGLVASVIAITAVLTKSVKTVKEWYRASKELEALEVGSIPSILAPLSTSGVASGR